MEMPKWINIAQCVGPQKHLPNFLFTFFKIPVVDDQLFAVGGVWWSQHNFWCGALRWEDRWMPQKVNEHLISLTKSWVLSMCFPLSAQVSCQWNGCFPQRSELLWSVRITKHCTVCCPMRCSPDTRVLWQGMSCSHPHVTCDVSHYCNKRLYSKC